MKAIILAAGNSTRYGENKLLAKFNDKTLPEYNIDFCAENGIKEIYITLSKNQVDLVKRADCAVERFISHPILNNTLNHVHENYSRQGGWGEDVPDINLRFKFQESNKYGPAAGLLPWINEISENEDVLILFGDNFLKGKFDKDLLKEFGGVATYKDLPIDPENTRYGAIRNNKLVEKPHSYTKGKFFIGFMYVRGSEFKKLLDLQPSERGEYEITEFFNSIKKTTITPVVEHWTDLTYKSDDEKILSAIRNSQK